jgi:hypothetical protein
LGDIWEIFTSRPPRAGGQQAVEKGDGGAGAHRGPLVQRRLPAVLEFPFERLSHRLGDVGVGGLDAVHLVAEAVAAEHFGDVVLEHPGLMAVAEVVRHQAGFDRQPGR